MPGRHRSRQQTASHWSCPESPARTATTFPASAATLSPATGTGTGNLDLLIGNFQGTFYLAENTGSAEVPSWKAQGEWIQGGDEKLLGLGQPRIYHSAPFVIDWDGDGDLDIISGDSNGGVYWAENSGTREAPVFGDFQELVAKPKQADLSRHIDTEDQVIPGKATRVRTPSNPDRQTPREERVEKGNS